MPRVGRNHEEESMSDLFYRHYDKAGKGHIWKPRHPLAWYCGLAGLVLLGLVLGHAI